MGIQAAFIVPHPPLIIPAVGGGREEGIRRTIDSYRQVAQRIAQLAPDVVVITSPHTTIYRDWFHVSPGASAQGNMHNFGAWNTTLKTAYDEAFATRLSALADAQGFPAGTLGEREPKLDHATYIPLWFMHEAGVRVPIVRIGLSGLSPLMHYQLGQLIAQCATELGRRCVFVASGDLSHKLKDDGPYGFASEGPIFDDEITQAMAAGDFLHFLDIDPNLADAAAECGLRSFQIMAGALDGQAVSHELLSHEGPFGVGYGVAAFEVLGPDPTRHFGDIFLCQQQEAIAAKRATEDVYVKLARASVERWVQQHNRLSLAEVCANPERFNLEPNAFVVDGALSPLPAEMLHGEGRCFVSLHEFGQLRGCIGTTEAGPLGDNVIDYGIHACSEDPRFDPVGPDELELLDINVDVLTEPEPIDSPAQLDPKRYGVIVSRGHKRGLLLPDLEGVDTVDQQISIAKRKAGIGEHEPVSLQRFEVVRHV